MTLSRDEGTHHEGTMPTLSFQLYKEVKKDGVRKKREKLHLSEINTITLSYFNASDSSAINTRTQQDVKNANNVTITATGWVVWDLQAGDTAAVDTTKSDGSLEKHIALFEWITVAALGGKRGKKRIPLWVEVDGQIT